MKVGLVYKCVYDDCYNVIDKIIKNAIDKSTTRKILKSKNKRLKEWMTNGILTSARRKQYLSMKCKKTYIQIIYR